ncbi:hypothetical protein [Phenylobacterium sp.]|jgi:hypothetical protein|uniref:hypothetical protein n=1 Tax=Phenylobacterium sp. TaxID=1871053 RepID=UPI0037CAC228
MIFPKRVFTWGGIFGLVMLTPMFFLESQMAAMGGPITRPENYYGFIGVAWAWQWVYLLIGRDPVRYRPIMPIGAMGKLIFVVITFGLAAAGRTPWNVALITASDLVIAILFLIAWRMTPILPQGASATAADGPA